MLLFPWWQFLSMKLASVNTRVDFSIESLIPKDVSSSALDNCYFFFLSWDLIGFWWFQIFQSNHSLAQPIFPLDSSATAFYGHQSQQSPAIHNNINPNGTMTHHSSVDPLDSALCQNLCIQLPPLNNGFNEGGSQVMNKFLLFYLQTNEMKRVHFYFSALNFF